MQTETTPIQTRHDIPMSDTHSDLVIPSTGEVISVPNTLTARSAARLGKSSVPVMTSIDTSTQEGLMRLSQHIQYQPKPDAKTNDGWYGREVDLVAYTAREVVSTKDATGQPRDCPKPLTMTVMEFADGTMIHSCSDYVFDSLQTIIQFTGNPSDARPIKVKLVKAGASDKLHQVFLPIGTAAAKAAAGKKAK